MKLADGVEPGRTEECCMIHGAAAKRGFVPSAGFVQAVESPAGHYQVEFIKDEPQNLVEGCFRTREQVVVNGFLDMYLDCLHAFMSGRGGVKSTRQAYSRTARLLAKASPNNAMVANIEAPAAKSTRRDLSLREDFLVGGAVVNQGRHLAADARAELYHHGCGVRAAGCVTGEMINKGVGEAAG